MEARVKIQMKVTKRFLSLQNIDIYILESMDGNKKRIAENFKQNRSVIIIAIIIQTYNKRKS